MTDLTNRVSKLEIKSDNLCDDIHDINTKVGHIESDMSELKTITKNNTSSNLRTNETLTDIHLLISEFKGGFKVLLWLVGSIGGLGGLYAIIAAIGS